MRLCGVLSAPPDAVLALDLYTSTGAVLLRAGTPLTPEHRQALLRRGIVCVVIEDEETRGLPVQPLAGAAVRARAMQLLGRLTAPLSEQAGGPVQGREEALRTALRLGRRLPAPFALGELGEILDRLLQEILAEALPGAMVGAVQGEGWLLDHMVETAALAVLLGRALGLGQAALRVLLRGALLHDLGMLLLPPALREKPGPLTAEERACVRQHPLFGWAVLRAAWPDTVRENAIALQHHERQDGTGYPQGLRGNNRWTGPESGRWGVIHPYAELVAVASVFVALQSDRPYRRRYPPEVAREILRRLAGTALNREIVETALRCTAPFPVGTPVRVVTGALRGWGGVVAALEPQPPYRPVIRLLRNARGERIMPLEVSVAEDPGLTIRTDWRLAPADPAGASAHPA